MIVVENLTVEAGSFRLQGVSLKVPQGGYGVLMGRTGSGKTTLLESILGLRKISSGRIWLAEQDVTHLNPAVRGIGYVPQDGALFSRMTVRNHLAFALQIRGAGKAAIASRVAELADLLGIGHLLDRTPYGLSGGERQRVALGRALSGSPAVLCLDEPLSALDHETRLQMCQLLKQIRQTQNVTALHVTHNRDEAERLSDHLFTLVDGQLTLKSQPDKPQSESFPDADYRSV